jgi:hypothetical protein
MNTDRPALATIPAARIAPEDDVWAWGGIHLADGRVISLAWLRFWPGAIASPPRTVDRAA